MNTDTPRLFPTLRSARAFLGNWLQGIHQNDVSISFDGDVDAGIKVIKQPHRIKDDMEIVEFELTECKRETDDFSQDVRVSLVGLSH